VIILSDSLRLQPRPSLTLIVVGRFSFAGGGEGGCVASVLAVDRIAIGVARVALNAHVVCLHLPPSRGTTGPRHSFVRQRLGRMS